MSNHTPEPCNGCIPAKSDDVRARYCKRPGTRFENGRWYCTQHAPSAVDARKRAADQAWERKMEEHRRAQEERANERARHKRCINALRGLDVEKVEALLDACRAEAASLSDDLATDEAHQQNVSARSFAAFTLVVSIADSIRAGGGQ